MLDLHLLDNSLFTHFNDFQVSVDLGSDHKIAITTINLLKGKLVQLKIKNQLQKV